MNGFALPLTRNLDNGKVRHAYNPSVADFLGRLPDWVDFPKQAYSGHGNESHLIHPQSQIEGGAATSSPKSYLKQTPDYYIAGNIQFYEKLYCDLGDVIPSGLPQHHTNMASECLGNAVELTRKMTYFIQKADYMPNLSLDADRGMGYRCWKHRGPINSSGTVIPEFIDS